MGQSNIAAGATIGSNHNSRANDGEIQAGRGFWPGLCTTLKHSCRFASFALLAKGDYPAELDIPLPFCLVSDDRRQRPAAGHAGLLVAVQHVRPGPQHLEVPDPRQAQDARRQHIEFDSLAPDTAEEMFAALRLLEIWTAQAQLRQQRQGVAEARATQQLARLGRELLVDAEDKTADLEVLGENMENSRRPTVVLKARKAYHAYREMLHYYAVRNLLDYLKANPQANARLDGRGTCRAARARVGQPGRATRRRPPTLKPLLADIKSGKLDSWPAIHAAYDALWADYPRQKQRHAYPTLLELLGVETLTAETWHAALDEAVRIQEYVRDQVYDSREEGLRQSLPPDHLPQRRRDAGRARHHRRQQLRQTRAQRDAGVQEAGEGGEGAGVIRRLRSAATVHRLRWPIALWPARIPGAVRE